MTLSKAAGLDDVRENDMTDEEAEKIAYALDKIGSALEGLHESAKIAIANLWPEPTGQREVIFTRAETADEKVLKEQGAVIPKGAIDQWLAEPFGAEDDDDLNFVGEREREFIERQRKQFAGAKADTGSGQESGGTETPQGETGIIGEGSQNYSAAQES